MTRTGTGSVLGGRPLPHTFSLAAAVERFVCTRISFQRAKAAAGRGHNANTLESRCQVDLQTPNTPTPVPAGAAQQPTPPEEYSFGIQRSGSQWDSWTGGKVAGRLGGWGRGSPQGLRRGLAREGGDLTVGLARAPDSRRSTLGSRQSSLQLRTLKRPRRKILIRLLPRQMPHKSTTHGAGFFLAGIWHLAPP